MTNEHKKNFPELDEAIEEIHNTIMRGQGISGDQILDALLAIKEILEQVKN